MSVPRTSIFDRFVEISADDLSSMPNLINPGALKLLECCVCQETIENPRRACENDHYNCLKCLEKIEETSRRSEHACACPTCREPLIVGKAADGKVGRPVPAICEVIQSQLCACPHGCGMVGPIAKLREHAADKCPKAPIKCPYWWMGCCFELIPRDEMDQHLKDYQSEHQMLMNNEQKRMREEVSWVGRSAKYDRKKIVESVTSYKEETKMIINNLTGTVRHLSEQNVALMDGFSSLCTILAVQNDLLEGISKDITSSSLRAARNPFKEAIKDIERKRKAREDTPPPRLTHSRLTSPSAPGAPGPSRYNLAMQHATGRDCGDEEDEGLVSRGHSSSMSPTYSPTSPTYSPTSPMPAGHASPTSPAYSPLDDDTYDGEAV